MKRNTLKHIIRRALLNEMYGWSSLQTDNKSKSVLSKIIMEALDKTEIYMEKFRSENKDKDYMTWYKEEENIKKIIRLLANAKDIIYNQM